MLRLLDVVKSIRLFVLDSFEAVKGSEGFFGLVDPFALEAL
jgi:hypothetical protein